jgi:hypothetical protein
MPGKHCEQKFNLDHEDRPTCGSSKEPWTLEIDPTRLFQISRKKPLAFEEVNRSDVGLQAEIFTRDICKIHEAWGELEVGGLIVGDVHSWRVDNVPCGGVQGSGLGREGVRLAIEDVTELRLQVLRALPGTSPWMGEAP